MRSQKPTSRDRSNEKGAALITAVLLSLLLLAAGGTLILTTTMSGITARDSTAEMQAYYAAEAGVARSLEVLKGNVESSPAGTRASFYNVLCSTNLWPTMTGLSRPMFARRFATCSWVAFWPRSICAGSPGMARTMKNTTTVTPKITGTD